MGVDGLREILTRMPAAHRTLLGAVLGLCPSPESGRAVGGSLPVLAGTSFGLIPPEGQAIAIEREISLAGGHWVANRVRGGDGPEYASIVRGVARHLGAKVPDGATVPELEELVVRRAWQRLLDGCTSQQLDNVAASLEAVAAEHGKSFKTEGGVLAALGGAHLASFSIYVVATSLLGGLTGVLGVTLPLGVYVGLTKALSVLLGPAGLVAVGVGAVYKAGAPDMKKLVPAVLMIAATRRAPATRKGT